MSFSFEVETGIKLPPYRLIILGPQGMGKSTWAASCPNPLFVTMEQGSEALDVARTKLVTTWEQYEEIARQFATKEHPYKTFVVDTIDWLEPLAEKAAVKEWNAEPGNKPATKIDGIGYGKGFTILQAKAREMCRIFDAMIAKGYNVVLLAHAKQKHVDPVLSEGFDTMTLKLNDKFGTVFLEWAHGVGFVQLDYRTASSEKGDPKRAVSSGDRVISFLAHPAHCGKNKWHMQHVIPFPQHGGFSAFNKAVVESMENFKKMAEKKMQELDASKKEATLEKSQ